MEKSFQKTLLDAPLRRRRRIKNKQIYFEPLAKPLQPTPYVPPPPKVEGELPPTPPPRFKRTKVNLRDPRVQKLIEETTPFYTPEAIGEFKEKVADKAKEAQREAFKRELASKLRKKIQMKIKERQKGLKGIVQSFELENISTRDPRMLFSIARNSLTQKLAEILNKKGSYKAYLTLRVEFKKRFLLDGEEAYEFTQPYFNSKAATILNEFDIQGFYNNAVEEILNRIARWISKGSGWVIERILNFYLNIVSYVPLKARSYFPLPEELRNSRKGLINLKNKDNECFRWCHVRHLHPLQHHNERITQKDREIAQTLNYSGVTFPVSLKDMDRIEKQNKININVFGYNEDVFPIRNSEEAHQDTLNVLLLEGEQESGYRQHYVLIKDFNRLNYNITKHKSKKHFCLRCLQPFYSEYRLEAHKKDCIIINGTQKIVMPEEGSRVQFRNYQNRLPVPFVVYADFEAITRKIDTCSPPQHKSYTQAYQKHEACGFSYKVVCYYDTKYSKPEVLYRGENVVQKF